MGSKSSIDQLNSFLRGELSAAETYRMAIEKLDINSPARFELQDIMASHERRAIALRQAVISLGGTPSESSGPWGVLVKAIEGTARVFGDKAAIGILEEGEDHGLKDYKDGIDDTDLDAHMRWLVAGQLMPEQEATHARMSALKKSQR